jgi:hypothetical protein
VGADAPGHLAVARRPQARTRVPVQSPPNLAHTVGTIDAAGSGRTHRSLNGNPALEGVEAAFSSDTLSEPLVQFQGVLRGVPALVGQGPALAKRRDMKRTTASEHKPYALEELSRVLRCVVRRRVAASQRQRSDQVPRSNGWDQASAAERSATLPAKRGRSPDGVALTRSEPLPEQ